MTKQQIVETIQRLLDSDTDLYFLTKLKQAELERLVAVIRNRLDTSG